MGMNMMMVDDDDDDEGWGVAETPSVSRIVAVSSRELSRGHSYAVGPAGPPREPSPICSGQGRAV